MNKLNIYLLFLLLLLLQNGFAEELPEGEVSFLPHMAIHFNEGCPSNSTCSKEMGNKRQEFINTVESAFKNSNQTYSLLNQYVKKNGIPFSVWGDKTSKTLPNFIWWDSACENHLSETNPIYVGIIFKKNLLEKINGIEMEQVFIKTYDKKIVPYYIPRGEIPTYFDNNEIVVTQSYKGHYFGVTISKDGQIGITKILSDYKLPKSIECPEDLVNYFTKVAKKESFYPYHSCKNIWSQKDHSYLSIITGKACL